MTTTNPTSPLTKCQVFIGWQRFLMYLIPHSATDYEDGNFDQNSAQIAAGHLIFKRRLNHYRDEKLGKYTS
jgi:hypothetical protein